jgi:hypothetical protein
MATQTVTYVDLFDLTRKLESLGYKVVKTNEITSLTAPADVPANFDRTKKVARQGFPLTDEEVEAALNDLVKVYPRVDKLWIDPPIADQKLFTFSFVPSSKAVPDEKGMFGVFKIRGVHPSDADANSRAETLVRNVDSYHPIYHGMVGRAHPLVPDPDKFTRESKEVDIRAHVGSLINDSVKAAREREQKELEEGNKRQKDYLTGESEEKSNNREIDEYTELQVKRANLIFAILDLYNNIRKFKKSIRETITKIDELDKKHPHYKDQYMSRYRKACDDAGIPELDNTIIKYMVGPPPFSTEDSEQERLLAPPDNEKDKAKGISYYSSDVYGHRIAEENKHLVDSVADVRVALLNQESKRAQEENEKLDAKKIENADRELENALGLSLPPCAKGSALPPITEEAE